MTAIFNDEMQQDYDKVHQDYDIGLLASAHHTTHSRVLDHGPEATTDSGGDRRPYDGK